MRLLLGRLDTSRAPLIVALIVLASALLLRSIDPAALVRVRDFAFDTYQRMQPRAYSTETPVRIVDIDEAALAEFGQWPWPRTIVARLIDKLTEMGAAVIAFDGGVRRAGPLVDPSNGPRPRSLYRSETVQKLAAALQDNDQVMADAMAQSRVVLGFGFDLKGGQRPPRKFHGVAFAGDDPSQFLPLQAGVVKPLDILEAAAKGNGSVNTDVESVVVRRVPMLFRVVGQEGLFPHCRSKRCGSCRRRTPM